MNLMFYSKFILIYKCGALFAFSLQKVRWNNLMVANFNLVIFFIFIHWNNMHFAMLKYFLTEQHTKYF